MFLQNHVSLLRFIVTTPINTERDTRRLILQCFLFPCFSAVERVGMQEVEALYCVVTSEG